MISYRDRTFCSASPTACCNTECSRYFGEEQRVDAQEWWGKPGALVCFGDLSKDCPDIKPPSLTDDAD